MPEVLIIEGNCDILRTGLSHDDSLTLLIFCLAF